MTNSKTAIRSYRTSAVRSVESAYLADDVFSGYIYADDIIKNGSAAYRVIKGGDGEDKMVFVGNLSIKSDNSWDVGEMAFVSIDTDYGEDIDYCVWSSNKEGAIR